MPLSRCSSLGHGHRGSAENLSAILALIVASEVAATLAYACRVQQYERGPRSATQLGHLACFKGTALCALSLSTACYAMQAVCMADNSRADTQLLDRGGAACFTDNMKIWKLFNSVVAEAEQCKDTCPPYPPTKSGAKKVCTEEPPLDPGMDDVSVDRSSGMGLSSFA